MSLSQQLSQQCAGRAHAQAVALMDAVPRIRAAEEIEAALRNQGIEAAARGTIADTHVAVDVLAVASVVEVSHALIAEEISFALQQHAPSVFWPDCGSAIDCYMGSTVVRLIVIPQVEGVTA